MRFGLADGINGKFAMNACIWHKDENETKFSRMFET